MATIDLLSGASGAMVQLTTDSPASRYNMPVLRIDGTGRNGEDYSQWPDMRPADMMPAGITAAEYVRRWLAQGEDVSDEDGQQHSNMTPVAAEGLEMARRFLAQWPEGPQA